MSIKIEFDSVSERKRIHNLIRDTANEISEETSLLQSLVAFENGNGRQDGFGYVRLNTPQSKTVRFYMSEDEFESHINELKSSSVNDLDYSEEPQEGQLNAVISKLQKSAEIMEQNTF